MEKKKVMGHGSWVMRHGSHIVEDAGRKTQDARRKTQDAKGFALIILIFAMMVFAILGWTLAVMQSTDFEVNLRNLDSERALEVAEAGGQWMLRQLCMYPWPVKNTAYIHTVNFGQYEVLYRDFQIGEEGDVIIESTGYIPNRTNPRAVKKIKLQLKGYIEDNAVSSTTSNQWQDKLVFTINLPQAADYLILASAGITSLSATRACEAALEIDGVIYHQVYFQPYTTVSLYKTAGFSKRINLSSGNHTLKIRYRRGGGAATVRIRDARMSLIRHNPADIFYNESEAATSTTSAVYVDKLLLNFVPPVSADYYVLATGDFCFSSATAGNWGYAQLTRGAGTEAEIRLRPNQTANYYSFAAGRRYLSLLGNQNFRMQYRRQGTSGQSFFRYCHLTSLNLTNFPNWYNESEAQSSTTSTTYQNKVILNLTPSRKGYYLVIASCLCRQTSSSYQVRTRLEIDNAAGYRTEELFRPYDGENWHSFFAIKRMYLDTRSHNFRITFSTSNAAGTARIRNARIMVISLPTIWQEQ